MLNMESLLQEKDAEIKDSEQIIRVLKDSLQESEKRIRQLEGQNERRLD